MTMHQPKSHKDIVHMDVYKLYNKLRQDIYILDDLGDVQDYKWGHGAGIRYRLI